jgi:hypothetical protein
MSCLPFVVYEMGLFYFPFTCYWYLAHSCGLELKG